MKLFLSTVGIILSSLFCACIAFHPQLLLQQPSSHGINSNGVNYGPNTRVHVVQFASAGGGPAVIERETTVIETTGPAVLDRPTTTTTIERKNRTNRPVRDRQDEGDKSWEVRIYNDGMNTREHVARSLVQITGISEMVAYQTMMQAHQNGMACVGRFCFEIAEVYHEGLKVQGIVSDIVPVEDEES